MSTQRGLDRGLGPWQAAAISVGTTIGTGVFLKAAVMAQRGGSAAWVLAAWAFAGLLSLAGAMTYAELGAMYPDAGGGYVYMRVGYGPFAGFVYGWVRFWIGSPGSIAAYAVGTATFMRPLLPIDALGGPVVVAIALIVVFCALNCLNVRSNGAFQTVLTGLKVTLIVGMAVGALVAPSGEWSRVTEHGAFPGASAFGALVLSALWAFDGWHNLPMAAGEVRDPGRNVPRAIVGGSLAVLAIYAIVHIGYFRALPFADIASSNSVAHPDAPAVAQRVGATFLGGTAQVVVAIAMILSALSAMNGSILTGARVPYALANDGLAPRALAKLSASRVPARSVIAEGLIACAFAASARFDQITDAVVFASWLFYAMNAAAVILLRRRDPQRERPYRVPGYPVVPIIFVGVALLLLANTLITAAGPSLVGLGITALGAVAYAGMKLSRRAS